ncbi:MAG: TetR/AcrR family transcriptional regulator [Caulobacter sp.]|nr:TetR/AcrR family transcriptional regulator [Caulobacter sp.]
MSVELSVPGPAGAVDGRRKRSEASRLKIVEAMIALVREGHTLPSAEAVAARAGVGLRTVFRLFEDMDGVYRGMQAALAEEIGALLEAPIVAPDWRAALDILIGRRARAYEAMLPLQIAADGQRHRSRALQEGRARLVRNQRDMLLPILPPAVVADPVRLDALDLTLSFDAWRRLRMDQGADVDGARAILRHMALTLIGEG